MNLIAKNLLETRARIRLVQKEIMPNPFSIFIFRAPLINVITND